jgi:DNA-binding transcriptional MerR regulator
MPDGPVYSIGAVSKMLDVPVATLRTWEERYDVVRPTRSPGGHRLYSVEQTEQLRFVVDRVGEGISPRGAHRLLAETLERSPRLAGRPSGDVSILILLAEPDPYAAEFAEYFLRTEGFEVVLALDAMDAERISRARAPHVAIIDLLLVGSAGIESCRRIAGSGALVLAVSPLDQGKEAIEAGASAFLQKPLDPLKLVATVKTLTGTSATQRRPVAAT